MRTAEPGRTPYRQVLAVREFRAILLSYVLSILGDQVARIAVSLLVFERSRSALAATATYAASFVPTVVGGPLLSTFADRYPRRTVMVLCDLARVFLVLALVLATELAMPLPVAFVLLLAVGLLETPFLSARSGVLPEVLPGDDFVVGNGVLHIVSQAGQVLGYLAGGALVAATSVRGALVLDAATFLASAVLLLLGLRHRVAPVTADERGSLLADTLTGARWVLRNAPLRRLLGCALLSTAAIIVPEGLAVPVAAALHGGPVTAGVLTAAVPAGYVLGSALLLRVDPGRRERLLVPLLVGSCLPLLLTPLTHSVTLVSLLWVVSGACAALQFVANAAYVSATPAQLRGRAFGVANTSLYAVQAVAVLAGGALADLAGDPRCAVAAFAGMLLAALVVAAVVRRSPSVPHGSGPAPSGAGP